MGVAKGLSSKHYRNKKAKVAKYISRIDAELEERGNTNEFAL